MMKVLFKNCNTIMLLCLLVFTGKLLQAQAPVINYGSGTKTFNTNTAITALTPVNTGGVANITYTSSTPIILSQNAFKIALDKFDNLYMSDILGTTLYKLTPQGSIKIIYKDDGLGDIFIPSSLCSDKKGNIYVAPYGVAYYPFYYKFDKNDNKTTISIDDQDENISTIASTSSGDTLYYCNSEDDGIHRIIKGNSVRFSNTSANALTVDTLGVIYAITILNPLSDYYGVIKMLPNGSSTILINSGNNLNSSGLTLDSANNIYVTTNSNQILKYDKNGLNPKVIIPSGAISAGIIDIAIDKTSNIFVSTNGLGVIEFKPKAPYSISPALPVGLTMDTLTGIISGTPTVTQPATNYTITAYNASGSNSTTVTIAVTAACTPTSSTTTLSACGSYTWNSVTYNNSGTYSKTFTGGNSKGCDSTATLNLTINPNLTPAVSISPTSTSSASQTFTATASNTGGGVIAYTFLKGIASQQTSISNTWNATGLANGDVITCGITVTGGTCLTASPAVSNQASVCVTGITPALGITPTTATSASTTFTANVINSGGGIVTYNFKKNNISQQNTTTKTWNATGLVTGDVISCSISISGGSCLTATTANSANTITACVGVSAPTVTIGVNNNPVCSGSSVQFTATPQNATNPTYSWLNGVTPIGAGATISSSSLTNGAAISCVMTANNTCGASGNYNSNTVTLVVNNATSSSATVTACGNSYIWNGQTYTTGGTYSKTFTGGNAKGCDSTATLVLSFGANSWTGAASSVWTAAGNWSCGVAPSAGDNVNIPATATGIVLTANTTVGNINIASGSSVKLNGFTLIINGTLTGTGIIKGSASSGLTINSSSNNTLYMGTTATDSLLNTLTISGAGTTTLATGLGITGMLNITSGGFNTGNHITLKSTSIANTGVVGPVSGTVTGRFTVERYIPVGIKALQNLSCGGVYNAGSIFNNWQEKGVNNNGYGILVTGKSGLANGVDATTGFDISGGGNKSIYNYISYNTYTPISNTKNTNLDPYTGYLTTVYGNRVLPLIPGNLFDASPNMNAAATIRTTGQLVTGTVTYTNTGVSNTNYSSSVTKMLTLPDTAIFVANPYACAIDWNSLAKTGIDNTYYYLDPTFLLGGSQQFVSYNSSTGNSNPANSKMNQYIQPGQGFWLNTDLTNTTNRKLVITESNKVTNKPLTAVFGTGAAGLNRLAMSLWKQGQNIDGTVAVFDNNFTTGIGEEDSKKMLNKGENLYIKENNRILSIDGIPVPDKNDVITLEMSGLKAGTGYEFHLDAQEFSSSNGLTAYLKDAVLNTETAIGTGSTVYSFTATAASESRFSVIYKQKVTASNTLNAATVSVYPNPVTDKVFSVQMNNIADGRYRVRIINTMGQEVMSKEINHLSGNTEKMNTVNLAKGVYTVLVEGKGVKTESKLIIDN